MKRLIVWSVIVSLLTPGVAWAQERVSPKLALAGAIVALMGVSLILNIGEEDVEVLDEKYCVNTNYYDVDYGGCGTPMEKKVGAGLIGAGVLMLWIGGREKKYKVKTNITKTSKSASVTVAWGGSHGR